MGWPTYLVGCVKSIPRGALFSVDRYQHFLALVGSCCFGVEGNRLGYPIGSTSVLTVRVY